MLIADVYIDGYLPTLADVYALGATLFMFIFGFAFSFFYIQYILYIIIIINKKLILIYF